MAKKKKLAAHLQQLRTAYSEACNAYRDELIKQWDLSPCYGYWNSDVSGTLYHYGDSHALSMEEIIYIVENHIDEDEVLRWEDYCLQAHEFDFAMPSLMSWHMGCPRIPKETFDRLSKMKADLEKAIEEEKATHPVPPYTGRE